MGSRNSRLLQAGDYAIGARNYADYIERRLNESTTKRGQAAIPSGEPAKRPRTKVAIKPYGKDAGGNGFILVSASRAGVDKLSPEFASRVSKDTTTKSGADSGKGFTPAKVTVFIPDNKTGTGRKYAKSEKTKLNYIKYPGTSYTCPHGALTDNEEYNAGVSAVRAAIEAKYPDYSFLRISFKNEKF